MRIKGDTTELIFSVHDIAAMRSGVYYEIFIKHIGWIIVSRENYELVEPEFTKHIGG
jgi:hypothetical protein